MGWLKRFKRRTLPTVYLAGPMTGLPDFNSAEFAKYARTYRTLGYHVLSPPELDKGDYTQAYTTYIRRDLRVMADKVDIVALLPGWENSKGAKLEKHVAETLGLLVISAESGNPVASGGAW